MSVGSVMIGLQASRGDGEGVTTAEFLAPFAIQPGEVEATRADGGEWASGMVYFAVVRHSDYNHVDKSADAGAQSEAFFAGVGDAFRSVAKFFDQRPSAVTTAMRGGGLSLRLFVEVRMDQDQMELELPPELLSACGRHRLGVYVISNDIPAAEVLEASQA
ncbi:MAG: hypothetical protein KDA86_03720 [Planctomycetaceae bacterium]|nr:hypothetical protein [Planctomycetaceae bacterium]